MSRSAYDSKEYEKVMPFQLPSKEEWEEATSTLKLSESGKACLNDLLLEIDADIQQQKLYFKNHLTRNESIEKLKDLEKAAKQRKKDQDGPTEYKLPKAKADKAGLKSAMGS